MKSTLIQDRIGEGWGHGMRSPDLCWVPNDVFLFVYKPINEYTDILVIV